MELPRVGDLLAEHYRLDDIIGEGGFATVFRAVDLRIDRVVAIKVLRPEAQGYPGSREARFLREARIVGDLADAHTVRLFDFGRSDQGLLFMVFEHLPGEDLRELLNRRKKLTEAEVERIFRQILSSLREAHERQLVHRDVKPANIRIMGDTLRAKLMDFGVARMTHPDATSLTATGGAVGTVAYMPPEQMRGETPTPASDLYSLALTMAEALIGTWRGLRLSDTAPELPGALGAVLASMLQPEPSKRPQSVDAVLRLLDAPEGAKTTERAAPRSSNTARSPAAATPRSATTGWKLPAVAVTLICVATVAWAMWPPKPPPVPVQRGLPPDFVKTSQPDPDASVVRGAASDLGRGFDVEDDADPSVQACLADPPRGLSNFERHHDFGVQLWTRYVPKSYEPGRPHAVLLAFHNNFSTRRGLIRRSRLKRLAEQEKLVVFALEGVRDLEAWNQGISADSVKAMLAQSSAELCIDPARVFAFGHGTGGLPAEQLACEPWIRAVVTTSHRPNRDEIPCPDVARPYLYFYPTKTKHLPLDGAPRCASNTRKIEPLARQLSVWRKRNGCKGKPKRVSEHKDSFCEERRCDTAFVACRVDGGLEWPKTSKRKVDMLNCDGPPPIDYPYHERIVTFLRRFGL